MVPSSGPHVSVAPPHPRGYPPARSGQPAIRSGSPAPAGIPPKIAWSIVSDYRLPRTRGDTPLERECDRLEGLAPPHPRGYPQIPPPRRWLAGGSPAPAGIPPHRTPLRWRRRWLPRTRGDTPMLKHSDPAEPLAPPHPRGYPPCPQQDAPCRGGSPAPAGIPLLQENTIGFDPWLPRTRGDTPHLAMALGRSEAAPPHPRGYPLEFLDVAERIFGSPAPAGIPPSAPRAMFCHRRLPRTRGDTPTYTKESARTGKAPPHPRGYPPFEPPGVTNLHGSPAPAGIPPSSPAATAPIPGLPRTRGDS